MHLELLILPQAAIGRRVSVTAMGLTLCLASSLRFWEAVEKHSFEATGLGLHQLQSVRDKCLFGWEGKVSEFGGWELAPTR